MTDQNSTLINTEYLNELFERLMEKSDKLFIERKMTIYDKNVTLRRRSSVLCNLSQIDFIPYSVNSIGWNVNRFINWKSSFS